VSKGESITSAGSGARGHQAKATLEEKAQGILSVEISIIKDVAMDKDQFLGKSTHIPTENIKTVVWPRYVWRSFSL
jgi:hypothetical protein